MAELEKMWAMPFGEDGLYGDGGHCPNRAYLIEATTESAFEGLLDAWYRRAVEIDLEGEPAGPDAWSFAEDGGRFVLKKGDKDLEGLIRENVDELPLGFWILTDEAVEKVFLVDLVEAHGDSDGYVLIRAMKTIADHLACRKVGDTSALEGD